MDLRMKLDLAKLVVLCVLIPITGCFDNGVPTPPPDPLTLAREYSGLWVPERAQLLKYEDSFYNEQQRLMHRQGLLGLTMQLTPTDFAALAEVAVARGYTALESRRAMPPDSIRDQDVRSLPVETPGLYQISRGQGPNRITVILREDTHTLQIKMVQLLNHFFPVSATDSLLRRYSCSEGSCSVEPIGRPRRR